MAPGLRLEEHWLWDFWIADDGDRYHLFHLQAARSLGDPDLRHWNASVGHATSTDLRTWTPMGTALSTGDPGAWDDAAVWTGSVIRHDVCGWAMLYTGCSTVEDRKVQRIGLATSPDLQTWTRHPDNPLIEADAKWYERMDADRWHDEAWRDPWILEDPDGDGFHALITARVPDVTPSKAGVIGHAWSPDLTEWEVRPPLTGASGIGYLEVPQVVVTDRGHLLVYSYSPEGIPPHRQSLGIESGSYAAPMDGPLGPAHLDDATRIGPLGSYSNKVVRDREGRLQVLGFDNRPGPDFGTLTQPTPLDLYLRA